MVDVGSILLTCCIHCFILIWLVLVVLAGSLHQCISWNSDSSNAHFWRDHVTWWCCPWCSGWRCQLDGQWRGWHPDPPRWWPTSWTSPPQWEWSWPCQPVRRHRCGLLWILTIFYIIVTIFLTCFCPPGTITDAKACQTSVSKAANATFFVSESFSLNH